MTARDPLATLARAVEILRERAGAATPGPWVLIGGGEYVTPVGVVVAPDNGGVSGTDALWIALADPGLGLLVADWLREAAGDLWALGIGASADNDWSCLACGGCINCDDDPWAPHIRRAYALALYIIEKEEGQ